MGYTGCSDSNYLKSAALAGTPNNLAMMGWFWFGSVAAASALFQFNYSGSSGTIDLEFAAAGALKMWTGTALADGGITLGTNRWYHLAITISAINGGTMQPYVNGQAGTAQTAALTSSTGPTYFIGRDIATGESVAASTRISDLKIWANGARVLTIGEIRREMRNVLKPPSVMKKDVFAWWPAWGPNKAAGKDFSFGRRNDAVVTGALTYADDPPLFDLKPLGRRFNFSVPAAGGGGGAAPAQNLLPLIGVG